MNYLIIHLVISILIFFVGAKKNPVAERLGNVLIAFFFPIGGVIIVILLTLLRDYKISELDEDDYEDPIILFTDRVDIDQEVNILPIEELLTLEDTTIKRRQVIDTLKQDLTGLLDKLQLALRDDDVETSHYAASAISEIKRSMDLKLQQMQRIYDQQHDQLDTVDQYIEILKEYISTNLYDEISIGRIITSYEEVLKNRVSLDPESEPQIYNDLIALLLKGRQFEDAENYIDQYMEYYNNEDSYIYRMELHYMRKDREAFKKAYNVLLNSPVILTNKGLEIVRFWMDGMKDETVRP